MLDNDYIFISAINELPWRWNGCYLLAYVLAVHEAWADIVLNNYELICY